MPIEAKPERTVASWLGASLAAVVACSWAAAAAGLFGVWLAGQVFRDRTRLTDLCFLIPTLWIITGLLLAAVLARLCKSRRVAWGAAILALPPAFSLLFVENRWIRPAEPASVGQRLRLVHWNVCCIKRTFAEKAQRLKPLDADIYVLTEVFRETDLQTLLKVLGPEYRVYQVRQLAVFARGRVALERAEERIRHRGYLVHWDSRAGPVHLFMVDLPTQPIYDVNPVLEQVREHITQLEPDFVVGDFNVSRRTRALSNLPKGYSHAYYRAGAGWSYTWPAPFPLWDIDQCILGPRIQPLRYSLISTGLSDHRIQVLDFAVAPARE